MMINDDDDDDNNFSPAKPSLLYCCKKAQNIYHALRCKELGGAELRPDSKQLT